MPFHFEEFVQNCFGSQITIIKTALVTALNMLNQLLPLTFLVRQHVPCFCSTKIDYYNINVRLVKLSCIKRIFWYFAYFTKKRRWGELRAKAIICGRLFKLLCSRYSNFNNFFPSDWRVCHQIANRMKLYWKDF